MGKYALRRLLIAIPVLIIISIIDFGFISLAPGDPISAMMPRNDTVVGGQAIEGRREAAGLNDSIPVRYIRWVGQVVQGNLGKSFQTGQPVTEMISRAVPNTLRLTIVALLVTMLIGIPIGVYTATHEQSLLDQAITVVTYVFSSIPSFFLALLLVFVFAINLNWFPATRMNSFNKQGDLMDAIYHLVLPVLTLALLSMPGYARYVRASVLDVMRQDYTRTARAKGLIEQAVMWRHIFPNALAPVITLVGLSLPGLIGSSVLIEQVFGWPGMGTLSINAALLRDYPLFMGTSLLYASAVLLSNLVADILYAVFDPRIRLK